jgi:hypothetical protein
MEMGNSRGKFADPEIVFSLGIRPAAAESPLQRRHLEPFGPPQGDVTWLKRILRIVDRD